MKLVRICWNDTVSDCTWTCRAEAIDSKSEHCVTVGYLLQETLTDYILTPTVTDGEAIMGKTIIPKGCVTEIYELSEKQSSEITLESE